MKDISEIQLIRNSAIFSNIRKQKEILSEHDENSPNFLAVYDVYGDREKCRGRGLLPQWERHGARELIEIIRNELLSARG